ncbi:quinone oxidoreductase [Ruania suaedae]|uniref:quinone oxidoreductase family protein n=1 Tax=Ruania suaedae TaxID=2897774 RepID=UPI001E2AD8FC|nr:quinone oxidoreductase [Ruania suaedae]UFU04276.1 quinone oxidoreductase [Ruania suaedae]
MHAVVAHEAGGPEVMTLQEVPVPDPGPGQVLVRSEAAGVNFIDTYHRSGVYPVDFPLTPGGEGAGTVEAVGDGVEHLGPGDRVAWASSVSGSYADQVLVEAAQALPVPEGVSAEVAAAIPLQGMTAHMLVEGVTHLGPGRTVLLHAGAGGVGLLLTQLAVARGARVLTTVSTEEKAELSRAAGAAEVIRYDQLTDLTEELPALVRDLTEGQGVDVAYDGVGKATFDASLASVRRRGLLVLFGGASGQVPPVDLQRLNRAGSLFVTRPTLFHYIADAEERAWRAREVFDAVAEGTLQVRIGARFPLADAAGAHTALEGRATTGKVLLLP